MADHEDQETSASRTEASELPDERGDLSGTRYEKTGPLGRSPCLLEEPSGPTEDASGLTRLTPHLASLPDAARPGSVDSPLVGGRDETHRQDALDALHNAERRHRALLEGIPHLVWQSGDGGSWSAASPQWRAYTGQSEVDSLGPGWRAVIHPDDLPATDDAWRLADDSGVMTVDHRIRRHDGAYRWFQTRALPVPADAPQGGDRLWIGTSTDVDDLRVAEEQIRYLAFHDVLTATGNRAMLQDVLGRMTRDASIPFNVLYLDIDDFKGVNEQLGHRGGDEVLGQVSRQLIGCLDEGGTVTRMGGDEFVLVQANACARDGALLAKRIHLQLREPMVVKGQTLQLGASIGVASCPADGADAEELLRRADLALFAAKTAGGRCMRPFEEAMEVARQERLALQTGLARAIERDELSVAYQPVCDADTGTVRCYEALARWTHPNRGAVPPDVFIPIAEASGQIDALGEWVLGRACLDAAGSAFGARRVAVNLSPAQFRSGSLPRTIEDALDQARLPPDRLELEVTERLLMDSSEDVDRALREIKALGVRIVLDDFGTGYSNLGYLCRFPFDRLKIDRSFVRQMTVEDGARSVVSGIIALAHSLRMEVTAEGVETLEQLEMLRGMGCDQVQGYLLGRPTSAETLCSTS